VSRAIGAAGRKNRGCEEEEGGRYSRYGVPITWLGTRYATVTTRAISPENYADFTLHMGCFGSGCALDERGKSNATDHLRFLSAHFLRLLANADGTSDDSESADSELRAGSTVFHGTIQSTAAARRTPAPSSTIPSRGNGDGAWSDLVAPASLSPEHPTHSWDIEVTEEETELEV
jgi:hypothetical protein